MQFNYKDQKAKADSLRKIRDEGLRLKMPEYKLSRIEKEITNAVTIASDIDMIRKHLEAIKTLLKLVRPLIKELYTIDVRQLLNYDSGA